MFGQLVQDRISAALGSRLRDRRPGTRIPLGIGASLGRGSPGGGMAPAAAAPTSKRRPVR
eukprot:492016-Pyramimonas_sp.AAC.1